MEVSEVQAGVIGNRGNVIRGYGYERICTERGAISVALGHAQCLAAGLRTAHMYRELARANGRGGVVLLLSPS
jgi:hypothetical protein